MEDLSYLRYFWLVFWALDIAGERRVIVLNSASSYICPYYPLDVLPIAPRQVTTPDEVDVGISLKHRPNMDSNIKHFKVITFMVECGEKLSAQSVTTATAAHIYHKFFSHVKESDYDPYLIATSALYLAGKVEEDHLRLRDVINVSYRTSHKDSPPLEIGTHYWDLRETVTQCELFILRVLGFQVTFTHPHKFMLHYLKSVLHWMSPQTVRSVPIAQTAWGILNDSYHGTTCLKYSAEEIAVAAIYLSMEALGVDVPYNNDARTHWWEALCEDLSLKRLRTIVKDIIQTYELENMA